MSDPQTIDAIGLITMTPLQGGNPSPDAVQMTLDPEGYERKWDQRKRVIPGWGGSSTTQDWGLWAVDAVVTLTWGGKGQYLDLDVVRVLRTWQGVTGSTYRFQDGEGNDLTVEIVPPFSEHREWGMPRHYVVTLTLHVLAIAKLLGQSYTGQ